MRSPAAILPTAILMVLLFVALAVGQAPSSGRAAAADLEVHHPWARASLGAHQTGAAYLALVNFGESADRLVAVSTPAAKRAELHGHSMDDQGVMKMRPVEAIEVTPKSEAHLQPGGLHVMLMGLVAPLKEGDAFPMTLRFEKAGEIQVTVRHITAAITLGATSRARGTRISMVKGTRISMVKGTRISMVKGTRISIVKGMGTTRCWTSRRTGTHLAFPSPPSPTRSGAGTCM
jgi:copper(I)-binding protein